MAKKPNPNDGLDAWLGRAGLGSKFVAPKGSAKPTRPNISSKGAKTGTATHATNVTKTVKGVKGAGGTSTKGTDGATHATNLAKAALSAGQAAASENKARAAADKAKALSAVRGQTNINSGRQVAYDSTPPAAAPTPTSVFDNLNALADSGASAKTLKSYIKDANASLGKGTDYGALKNQLKSDTKTSDTRIGQMYAALGSGIRADDPTIKSIYDDTANQQRAAGVSARGSINSAYDSARAQTAHQAALQGATVSAADAANANGDQARNISTSAANQQSSLDQTSSKEANARQANLEAAQSSAFAGNEARSSLSQQLADNLAKVNVQQTTEDANRRSQATQLALQMQSNDQSQANNAWNRTFQLDQAKYGEQKDAEAASQAALNAQASNQNTANQLALQMYQLGLNPDGTPTAAATAKATDSSRASALSTYANLIKAYGGGAAGEAAARAAMKAAGYPGF